MTRPLEPAFPSSPTRNPRWGIRIHGRRRQNWHFSFCGTYAAKHFIECILAQSTFKWVSHEEIELFDPIEASITCEQPDGLDVIMNHKFTDEEATFTLPTPYPQTIAQMLGRPYFAADRQSTSDQGVTPEKSTKRARGASRGETPAKPDDTNALRKQKPIKTDGLIPLEAITNDPKRARNVLRKANFPKPQSGKWLFTEAEAEAAKKVLAS